MRHITHLVVHHTASAGATTTLAGVDAYHKQRNWGTTAKPVYAGKSSLGYYTQYHYFIDWHGVVTQTRTDEEIGWHGNSSNPYSIGICLAGWFDKGHDTLPTDAEVASLTTLLKSLTEKYHILPEHIVPHRMFAPKSCYGYNLSDTWASELVFSSAPAKPAILTQPHFEKLEGSPAVYAYDADTDTMVPFSSGRVFKMTSGDYASRITTVTQLSRPVSSEILTTTPTDENIGS